MPKTLHQYLDSLENMLDGAITRDDKRIFSISLRGEIESQILAAIERIIGKDDVLPDEHEHTVQCGCHDMRELNPAVERRNELRAEQRANLKEEISGTAGEQTD